MQGKGKQFVPNGRRVKLEFSGGAGYGDPSERDPELVKRDFARGYISAEAAKKDYGLSDSEIEEIKKALALGEALGD